ncbi:hypothetical protein AB4027_10075 [Alkalibacterium putridalgicola]|uniref:Uncharacterized protein n=1 Tax=Alkalibacterium putridalgicola TaxID=426703 RepID=A0A1H7UYM3_9LACT|nr:hypothetical protein [Alkalibacterium putridalgicola]GEK89573.1 hypothetical protein APU01nite_16120 [Alkalibacterium putridalgicola]SEM02050.1 hypothetical protein SAMN04488100_12052 [Alkalibacterium putridalgicola]
MKKLTKLIALTLTGGLLLVGCGETDDMENDLPDVEETEDDLMNDDLGDEMEDDAE